MKIQKATSGNKTQWYIYLPLEFIEKFELVRGVNLNYVISENKRTMTLHIPDIIKEEEEREERVVPQSNPLLYRSSPPNLTTVQRTKSNLFRQLRRGQQ